MDEIYFVIRNSDGDTTIEQMTRTDLLRRLNNGDYPNIFAKIPSSTDTNYWEEKVLIIKGTVVSPEVKQVITEYTIE